MVYGYEDHNYDWRLRRPGRWPTVTMIMQIIEGTDDHDDGE